MVIHMASAGNQNKKRKSYDVRYKLQAKCLIDAGPRIKTGPLIEYIDRIYTPEHAQLGPYLAQLREAGGI